MLDLILKNTLSGTGDSGKHLMILFSIAISIKAKTIFELGVRDGDTTVPLLYAAYLNGGKLWSVDKVKSKSNIVFPECYNNNWSYMEADAVDFLKSWFRLYPDYVVDLVYIDDWHSYEHVKKELELLDKIVSPSSVILLHDTMYGNWEPHYHCDLTLDKGQWAGGGPYRAVAELDKNFWEFSTIPSCNGLTILRKKYSSRYHK